MKAKLNPFTGNFDLVGNSGPAGVLSAPVIADTTLSGAPVVITLEDETTGALYYFKAFPTKP